MDNQYDFYGNDPQRPFTEKPGEQPQVPEMPPQNPTESFNPQRPLMQREGAAPESDPRPAPEYAPPSAPEYPKPQKAPEYPKAPGFAGYPDQRPFGEPQRAVPAQELPKAQAAPEFMGQQIPAQAPGKYPSPQSEYDFNPVEQTATYQDGAFHGRQSYPRESRRDYDFAEPSDYSQAQYFNPNAQQRVPEQPAYPQNPQRQPYPQNTAQPFYPPQRPQPQQPQPQQPQPQQPQQPPLDNASYPPAPSSVNPYEQVTVYQPQQKAQKPKSNKGLIAVIIVLSVLLAGSLAGIFFYVLSTGNRAPERELPPENGNGFTLPDFTVPYNEKEADPPVHNESDFSDKTDKNFSLKLEEKPEDADKSDEYTAENAFNNISESVVGVLCYNDEEDTNTASFGSGIIISEDGYIITNSHVVGNSRTAYLIRVVNSEGKEFKAGVVGVDPRTDIAVLKAENADNFKAAHFADSTELKVGDDLIVVGNPGGLNYQNTMTKGIVSALDRDASKKNMVKYIQTDAAINPGNSGGPAVNIYGQVVGIASAKIANSYYDNMCFCIPSSTAKTVVDDIIHQGYVAGRVRIGITGIATSDLDSYVQLPSGIYVQAIDAKGPCANTELKEGDVITKLDGKEITSFSDIFTILEEHKEGDKVKLSFFRQNENKDYEIQITLQADEG